MKRSTLYFSAGYVLWLATSALAQSFTPPQLRHVNYIFALPAEGSTIRCEMSCSHHGYQDVLRGRLMRPDGVVVTSVSVQSGEKSRMESPVNWAGKCVLEINSGSNLAKIQITDVVPFVYRSAPDNPMRTVAAWGPLHFYVPTKTKTFDIWVQADVTGEGAHVVIRNPAGKIVCEEDGDFDARTRLRVEVGPEHDGAAWSIEITKPRGRGLGLDDMSVELGMNLPPFLSSKPEWVKLFTADWKPEDKSTSTRLTKTEPKLPPFTGVPGTALDEMYSRDTAVGWHTSLPFTYVLDYGSKHLGNEAYVPSVATAPPVLLHLGKDVPFNHGWGPVKALGGENQAYGYGESIERLTPDQVRERITGLQQMVGALHKSGVRWVTPYVCAMTLDGNRDKRTGFWDFYDHWEDYRPLGLGPKPGSDPFEWLQREPDGTPHFYYKYQGDFYPPFKTNNHRYSACWRTEGWSTWLCEVIRFVAKCGCDGAFVDNGTSQRCHCNRCLKLFRERLKVGYTPEQIRQLFGGSVENVNWPGKDQVLLNAEVNRFWCDTLRDEMAKLKKTGSQELGREFIVFPNGGRPSFIQGGLRDADFVMFEKTSGEYGSNPGLVMNPVLPGVFIRAYNDNIFDYKYVQCLRRRVRPIILSCGGYPKELPHQVLNPNSARLGMAECGAFSGGGGFLLRPKFDVYHDALNEYRRFFETHPTLYTGLDSYGQVGVLAFAEQDWLDNRRHMSDAESLAGILADSHVLFDLVPELQLNRDVLSRYSFVVAPKLVAVSESQLAVLADYVKKGGHLILVDEFATKNETLSARELENGNWKFLKGLTAGQSQKWEDGRVSRCSNLEAVPGLMSNASVLTCSDKTVGPHVKVNAFSVMTGMSGRLILHVVNYNTQLGVVAPDPAVIDGIQIDIPLPAKTKVASARCFAPDEAESQSVSVRCDDGHARFKLPPLRIYRVVELQLVRD
ncbi:MAG: hypothetical protein PHR77_03955 [Kiritimatiellae bacterium]|nr:hypothetical protein [Kiritimatiellia bacterium]MDD5519943.1 hypothetical protein [Kiritimatiellia bacterium]